MATVLTVTVMKWGLAVPDSKDALNAQGSYILNRFFDNICGYLVQ
jgi:hypothetical protein